MSLQDRNQNQLNTARHQYDFKLTQVVEDQLLGDAPAVYRGYDSDIGKHQVQRLGHGVVAIADSITNGGLTQGRAISLKATDRVDAIPHYKPNQPEPAKPKQPIYLVKVLFSKRTQVGLELWIGGDRKSPLKIATLPVDTVIENLFIHNLGVGDRYVVGIKYQSSSTFFQPNNRPYFSFKVISPTQTWDFKSGNNGSPLDQIFYYYGHGFWTELIIESGVILDFSAGNVTFPEFPRGSGSGYINIDSSSSTITSHYSSTINSFSLYQANVNYDSGSSIGDTYSDPQTNSQDTNSNFVNRCSANFSKTSHRSFSLSDQDVFFEEVRFSPQLVGKNNTSVVIKKETSATGTQDRLEYYLAIYQNNVWQEIKLGGQFPSELLSHGSIDVPNLSHPVYGSFSPIDNLINNRYFRVIWNPQVSQSNLRLTVENYQLSAQTTKLTFTTPVLSLNIKPADDVQIYNASYHP